MRYFTLLVASCCLLLGLSSPGWAQDGRRSVKKELAWAGTGEVPGPDRRIHRVPTFRGIQHRSGSLQGYAVVQVPGTVAEGQVRNAVYAAFSPAEAALLRDFKPTADTAPEVFERTEKGQPVTLVLVPAMRRSPQSGQVEKLISFEYSYISGPPVVRRGQQITYASRSVLASGTWYKVGVDRSGIFKLDRSTLASMGFDVQSLDPSRLQIFGNATGMLPQAISTRRPDDLVENAVYFSGDNNDRLDANEYFLFYARGPHVWEPETTPNARRFRHVQNIYSDTAYYFVTLAAPPRTGRRITAAPSAGAANSPAISQYTARWFWERELVNLAKSGRVWLGEGFNPGAPQFFDTGLTDLVPGSAVQITSSVAGTTNSTDSHFFRLTANGTALPVQLLPGISDWDHPEYAATSLQTFSVIPAASTSALNIGLTYSGGSTAKGYLDYLEVHAERPLRLTGPELEFRSFNNLRAGAVSPFVLAGAAATTQVWEVTNPRRPLSYALGSGGTFVASTDSLREFVALNPAGSFPAPRSFGRVANQDLHGTLNPGRDLDMVIVTHPMFRTEAQRLANWRTTHDGLKVAVVTTTQVYNEFGGGSQDVSAIRDMMKMVYDQRDTPSRNQYLLLFGDASYDYKSKPSNLNNLANLPTDWWSKRSPGRADAIAQNYVPTYESRESFAPIYGRTNGYGPQTFCSDDYFGILDESEGEWSEGGGPGELMDVAVGRLPVRALPDNPYSAAQATEIVNKLIAYDSRPATGKWRNRVTFVADDQDGSLHVTSAAEPFSARIERHNPAFNIRKVYLDMYPQVNAAGGEKSPDCNRAVDESFEQGSLIINYNGHGGPTSLAQEEILTKATVTNLRNRDKLAFMVTGTCDFSTYDDPERTSAGEMLFTDTQAGAIGLYTTTRLVFSTSAPELVPPFLDSVLTLRSGLPTRLGDATRFSKNEGASVLNRNYVLLGDPSARLARPDVAMVLDSINGKPATTTSIDTLRALAVVRLSGSVRTTTTETSPVNTAFSGLAQVTVYEKPSTVRTLATSPDDIQLNIPVQENVIYDGQATVTNGRFTVQFVVPRDINYNVGLGKVSLYAANNSGTVIDAHGYRSVPVGDASTVTQADTIPPRITLFMDNEKFVFGGLTSPSPTLIAQLFDESGINTTGSGIGHEITATLDNDPTQLTVLNSFYTAKTDNFKEGTVNYGFKDLSTGPHVLHLKAWDTYNNSAVRDIEFIAATTDKLALSHVLNYPNPFASNTTFHFDHNRPNDVLDVQVQIFTVSGRLVRTLQTTVSSGASHVPANYNDGTLSWNGRDEFNDQLARGVYVYRVSVRSQNDKSTTSKFEKLVILN
ncbi:type IX secretion system sortase PorU [Hymenobacter psychrotolerans]|uniref:Por secretion system C-terminal sorting domain-containing protein n=1 Tax=Hymenobacter psychrotolerans DSM 18569 TaxID=1121959 RepID=A0A1M6YSB0_9BACT|nr:type IX secretion system sortase PorU [Hymenobacter psychrotolerans]SHL20995.1 Por secretion system C-terminal sorting domain-containing protein [Hymenobacter psychrotolerans DSM 18569]